MSMYHIFMIRILGKGEYVLVETRNHTKVLLFNTTKSYAWIPIKNGGEILVTAHAQHLTDHVLTKGNYRLYDVADETKFENVTHLELFVGKDTWQGYLLPKGLPTEVEKRHSIIPTKEIITKSSS